MRNPGIMEAAGLMVFNNNECMSNNKLYTYVTILGTTYWLARTKFFLPVRASKQGNVIGLVSVYIYIYMCVCTTKNCN